MSQITTGIRSVFSNARIYQLFQDFLGKKNRGTYIRQYVKPEEGNLLLDVGCGTGDIVNYLPEHIKYIGLDLSENYIETATELNGEKGLFFCSDISDFDFSQFGKPDIVLMKGLLHHLSDLEVSGLFSDISEVMHDETRVITIDPCYLNNMNPIARFAVSKDRGQNVRYSEGYYNLAKNFFEYVELITRTDLIRVPYAHTILQCSGKKLLHT